MPTDWFRHDALFTLVCEVRDTGTVEPPVAGRERPRGGQVGGYGVWPANQLCDLVQVRSYPRRSTVRAHLHVV
jgi:hypothetical protein